MITPSITIDNGRVSVNAPAGDVWMTQNEIARLFGAFVSAVGANIRSIFKNDVLREENVSRRRTYRDGSFLTLYNMEMITTLAFRLKSQNADIFRRWIVERAVQATGISETVIVCRIPRRDAAVN